MLMPINDYFIFNGEKSTDYGLYMAKDPSAEHPARRGEGVQIPGRNGIIMLEDGTFETYTQTYDVFLDSKNKALDIYGLARRVAQYLLGSRGFCRLEDSYEPEYFRLARCAEQLSVENRLVRFGRTKINFECQPQRYLKSGETSYKFSVGNSRLKIAVNPIPNGVESVRLDSYGTAFISAASASLMVYDSNDESKYTIDNLHKVQDEGDWKYTNVMEDAEAQFKPGVRYSKSSHSFVGDNNPACDCVIIPVPSRDTSTIRIRIKNATFSAYNTIYGGYNGITFLTDYGRYQVTPTPLQDENGDYYFEFQNTDGCGYITFNLEPVSDPASLIVTVNEPIVEIDADGKGHYVGTLNVGEYDAILVDAPILVTSHLTYIYADGSTEEIAATSGISFALNNPTSQTAQPLIRFATTEHAPVNQTLTYVSDSFIDPNGKVSTAVAQSARGRYRTTSPVSVSNYDYAYITGRSYTFLDGNGNSVGFSPYMGSQSNEFHNTMLTIPSGAATIVLGGNTDDDFALALQEATPSQTTGSIAVNNTVTSVNLRKGDVVYLDCDLHDAYYPGGGNANAAVSFAGADEYPTFPSLAPGMNMISVVNTEHFEVEILPRWWVL